MTHEEKSDAEMQAWLIRQAEICEQGLRVTYSPDANALMYRSIATRLAGQVSVKSEIIDALEGVRDGVIAHCRSWSADRYCTALRLLKANLAGQVSVEEVIGLAREKWPDKSAREFVVIQNNGVEKYSVVAWEPGAEEWYASNCHETAPTLAALAEKLKQQ